MAPALTQDSSVTPTGRAGLHSRDGGDRPGTPSRMSRRRHCERVWSHSEE